MFFQNGPAIFGTSLAIIIGHFELIIKKKENGGNILFQKLYIDLRDINYYHH